MHLKLLKFILLLIIGCVSISFALPNRKNLDVLLLASKVKFDNKNKKGEYWGDILIQQGDSSLKAEHGFTMADKNNQLVKAIALGTEQKLALFETLANNHDKKIIGQAKKIVYYPRQQKLYLSGEATIKQGANVYQAPSIVYDINKKRIISSKHAEQRSTIIIQDKIT